ncbi:ras-related and estrogen-regulated growth inhibitor-like protein isoform X1 [Tympanuchus pallidicinctus]|uniref:ras-related and estrogen-regulated growth inhibitor-like protein isoform X1 n=2 Tax=Tetraoninae TaxID=466585 RepID=UPI00228767FA|nr:ras-related and estrogen-regulated growth inhibitor-like protein isoform X1 [Tympanuchus pallidicinctus]
MSQLRSSSVGSLLGYSAASPACWEVTRPAPALTYCGDDPTHSNILNPAACSCRQYPVALAGPLGARGGAGSAAMGLRLRRSASFTPEHPALLELPSPVALRAEANVLVMGADSVGKSALTVRFLTRRFIGEYGDMEFIYSHTVTVDGREVLFHIWDVPSSQDQADDGSSEEKRIQWADCFILVYSICDRASFNLLPLKVQFIRAAKEGQEQVPIVIVGNKRDLQHRRAVSSEEGRLLALSLDCGFYEVSAAEAYHGALMVFHGLAERIPDTRLKRGAGIRGIVRTVSAVFARKRTDSL